RAGSRLKVLHARAVLYLPQANASIDARTCQRLPVRAQGQRGHRPALSSKRLHERLGSHNPMLDEGLIPAAGEQAPIRSKGHVVDVGSQPLPEQVATLQVPQLEAAVPAAAGQESFVWAEGEGSRRVGMRQPGKM